MSGRGDAGRVRVGVLLPHTGRAAGPDALRTVAEAAERLGYDGVWVGDHVLLPADQTSVYPYGGEQADDSYEVPVERPFMEAFTTLGFVAATTERLTVGVSVGIAPYRHPAMWAKQIGTIDLLTRGRFVLGVGAGWLREEFDALGAGFGTRGRRTDETLRFLRSTWETHGPVTFSGDHFPMPEPMHLNPGAGLATPPPVWVGGNGPPALKRTARYGDAWHPHIRGTTPQSLAAGLGEIAREAEALGREQDFRAALHCPLVLTDRPGPDPAAAGRFEGPPEHVRALLDRYAERGLRDVIFSFGGGPARRVELLERLAPAVVS